MDDEEALLDNDPLALYLKNENIYDFETADLFPKINNYQHELINNDVIFETCEISQCCLEKILKSELLLEEDYNILDLYVSNNVVAPIHTSTIKRKIIIFGSLAFIDVVLFKFTSLKFVSMFTSLFAVPLAIKLYHIMHKAVKKRVITLLLEALKKCSNTIKKCIRYITELSTTIGYYSSASISNSSINNAYIRFVKNIYGTLLNIIKEIAFISTKIISIVPLKVENNLQYTMKEDLFLKEDINITDLKVLFELYLLVQSDFVKTLGLSLCGSLWKKPYNNINRVLKITAKLTTALENYENNLKKEYLILRNYGTTAKNIFRSPKKIINAPSDHMISYLYSTELHFQQLLCKSRDVQNILTETKSLQEDETTKIISTMLSEMEKQLSSCKNMLENVTKYFYQIQNKTLETDNKVTMPEPIPNTSLKSVEDVERDLAKQDKLTYELYIPKEGLPLSELEADTERAVFSIKNLDYSNVLLQELRTILKVRNPEIFEEQQLIKVDSEILSESDDEDESFSSRRRKNDIFRPIQPVGLAENLQTISQIIAARKNLMPCEEICEDTFGSSDIEES